MSGYTKNAAGVKDGADCYRTIGGVRWLWWSEDPAVFKAGGVRHRSAPGGEGTFVHPDDDALAQSAVAAWNTRALSQTLPAPGEVEAVAASASIALMYLQTGFIECPQCGEEVPTKDLDATHELATVVQPAPITGAPTLATVAAANDEGVAKAAVDTSEYRTDYQIGKADGIEAAAKVADDLALVGILTPGWLDGASSAQRQIAAAIRLLSQGGGK